MKKCPRKLSFVTNRMFCFRIKRKKRKKSSLVTQNKFPFKARIKKVISQIRAKITLSFIRFLRSNEIFDRIMSNSSQFFSPDSFNRSYIFPAFPSPFLHLPSRCFLHFAFHHCLHPVQEAFPLSRATKRTGHDNSTIFLYRFLKSALWCQEDHAKYKNVKI